ncbi:alanine racemase [Luteococcus sp.]|uniref:alanine racemase n=1 Tax=Luteococcus sp. TaxID=1969402 RepID=UPI003736FDD1
MLYTTHAPVDLGALHHNLLAVRQLAAGREVALAVKADAYGHGAVAVAQLVQETGCADRLAVATVPEALELRRSGITLPILKLSHCFQHELFAAVQAGVTLTVVDERTIRQAEGVAAGLGVVANVHLKVDTGMRRIGAEPEDATELVRLVDTMPHLFLEGIFTHPPVSDVAEQYQWTAQELGDFRALVTAVEAERGPIPLVHAAPSGAILGHDLEGMTMVRPGIIAYGYYPDPTSPHTIELQTVMGLTSRISFLKQVEAGQSVGYGRTWTAGESSWIATIPVGYADGYSRSNSNVGHALVGGRRCPVAGRVCMDQTMIDLGPELGDVQVGNPVVLMGRQGQEQITADDLASIMGTISYEVLCRISPRVTRVYLEG